MRNHAILGNLTASIVGVTLTMVNERRIVCVKFPENWLRIDLRNPRNSIILVDEFNVNMTIDAQLIK